MITTLFWVNCVRLDNFITRQAARLWQRCYWLNAVMVVIAKYTPIFMIALIVIAASGLSPISTSSQSAVWGSLDAIVAAVIIRVLHEPVSRLTARPRPFDTEPFQPLLAHDPGESFPSNHAGGAMALAYGSLHLGAFFPILLSLALGLCLARIYCGLHHLSDVVVGAVGGATVGYVCACVQRGISGM